MHFLDPKVDIAFKKIFSTEHNQAIIIHFLNDMMAHWRWPPITQVTVLPSLQQVKDKDRATNFLDVMCEDVQNRRFVVEIQVCQHRAFVERVQLYNARAYVAQNQHKVFYQKPEPLVTIVISEPDIFPNKTAYMSYHSTLDQETGENDLQGQRYVIMNLAKFKKAPKEIETIVDKWCYFFKYTEEISREDLKRLVGEDEIIERAYLEMATDNWDKHALDRYHYEVDQLKVYESTIDTVCEKGFEQEYKEGLDQALKERSRS
jgi:predicted transposase/invertase (TIGR01784 family)